MERSLTWDGSAVVAVDQLALPDAHRLIRLSTVDEVIAAITRLSIRGAPAIGVAAALAVALSARAHTRRGVLAAAAVRRDADRIAAARPTAVNLAGGVRRALSRLPAGADAVLAEALAMLDDDERVCRAAARRAAALVDRLCPDRPLRLHTHCNTGGLATVAWGTALGAVRDLAAGGRVREVLVGETRPLLQGARLTTWELRRAGVPHRLCVDSAGPAAIASGLVDCVLVGADRVAANGDVANKIGTYSLACAADRAGIPFIVVAPESTLDAELPTGEEIVIEQRPAEEVATLGGRSIAPPGTAVYNPAFDITPAALVTAVVTERRVLQPAGLVG
jgi:methylthioribose-1-phosphate isomerase/methylthioribulose-1-phosphate dehydratase